MKKILLFAVILTLFASCDELLTYNVSDVLDMNPRELEKMKQLRVKGIVGNSVNLGILNINAFALRDVNDPDKVFYVNTDQTTLPANEGEKVTLKVKLWKEINVGFTKFYLMEEITE